MSQELGSITYLDSENLFYSLGDRAEVVYQALYQWCDDNAAAPREHRSYGKFHDPRLQRIREVSQLLRTIIVSVPPGPDEADNRILRDLGAGHAEQFLIGSGDKRLLSGAAALKTINWVIVPPHANVRSSRNAVPGAWILELRKLYRRELAQPHRRPWPSRHTAEQILPKWAELINPDLPFTDQRWAPWALHCLRARGWEEQHASELVTVLTRWLPEVVPSHHHNRDFAADVEANEAWRWYCMAAVAAAAIEPGASDRHISSILFRAYSRDDSEWWVNSRRRAKQVVQRHWSSVGDREDYLLATPHKHAGGSG